MVDVSQLRADLVPFVLGALLLAIGLGALAVALVRRSGRDALLLSFAAFSSLYGLRLACGTSWTTVVLGLEPRLQAYVEVLVTYWIGVPGLLFFGCVVGARFERIVRWLVVVALAYALTATAADLLLGQPGAAMGPNAYLVLGIQAIAAVAIFAPRAERSAELRVLRWSYAFLLAFVLNENLGGLGLPSVPDVEVFGFLGFLAGLGYMTAQRVFGNEQRLATLAQELETARRIQASILPRGLPNVAGVQVAVRYQPMTAVAGDYWDFLADDDRVGLLVADVSGHGVAAALVASMVKVAFEAQRGHAAQPAEVVSGMNAALCRVLDGPFVTAVYASLSPGEGRLRFAGAGHPPALLRRAGSGRVERLSENGLLMGFDGVTRYEAGKVPVEPGDRLLLFTDGLIEATDAFDEQFGLERLEQALADGSSLGPEALADRLLAELRRFRGTPGFEDDLTLLVADLLPVPVAAASPEGREPAGQAGPGNRRPYRDPSVVAGIVPISRKDGGMFKHRDLLDELNQNLSIEEKIGSLLTQVRAKFPTIGRIAVALYEQKTDWLRTYLASGEDENPLQHYAAKLSEAASLQAILRKGRPRVVNDLGVFDQGRHKHTQAIRAQGYGSSYTMPMYVSGTFFGFLFFNSHDKDVFTEDVLHDLDIVGHLISLMIINEVASIHTLQASLKTAVTMVSHRDVDTGSHLDRMSNFALLIARELAPKYHFTDEQIEHIFFFAPLHDMGKIGIPDHILKKRGKLTDLEFEDMKEHTTKGLEIIDVMLRNYGLEGLHHVDMLRNIALYHHEAINGCGYPKGLKGDEIPIEARIVSVADIFDALTSKRPYKKAWSNDEAFTTLREMAGTQVDQDCVEALIQCRGEIEQIQTKFKEDPYG